MKTKNLMTTESGEREYYELIGRTMSGQIAPEEFTHDEQTVKKFLGELVSRNFKEGFIFGFGVATAIVVIAHLITTYSVNL